MALYLMHISSARILRLPSLYIVCALLLYICLGAVTLVDTFERHVHISLQYRISRLFVEKTSTVISRGFQLKHIPSGEVIRYPFSLCMFHVWQCNHHDICCLLTLFPRMCLSCSQERSLTYSTLTGLTTAFQKTLNHS